jgi:hypothetical protein
LSPKRDQSEFEFLFQDYLRRGESAREDLGIRYAYEKALEIAMVAEQVGRGRDPFIVNTVKTILSYFDFDDLTTINELSNRAKEYLQPYLHQAQLDPNPFRPYPGREVYGPVFLGFAHQGSFSKEACPAGLTLEELSQHILIIGRTGSGKTNLIFFMLQSILGNFPVWIFDFKKDYRYLLRSRSDMLVIDWKDLRFNPLRPPQNVDPGEWLQVFTNTFCEALGLLYGSKTMFRAVVDKLYQDYGVYSGSEKYPSFIELQQAFSGLNLNYWKERVRADYFQRCLSRVDDCVTVLGKVFNCRKGFPLEWMLEKNVIFELHGLADSELQNLLLILLLSYVFMYRIANEHRGGLRHVMVFDEAKRVFDINRERMPAEGIPTIAILASQVREFGEALIVSDQMIRLLGESIKSNVATKVCMSLADGADLMEMARSMGLSQEQAQYLQSITVGQSVVRFSARYPQPFVLLTPEVPLKKMGVITDDQIREMMSQVMQDLKSWAEPVTEPGKEVKVEPEKPPEQPTEPKEEAKEEKEPARKKEEVKISGDAMKFLTHVRDKAFIPYSQRLDALDWGGSRGEKAQNELLKNNLVKVVKITTSKKGGMRSKFFEITPEGEALVGKQNLGPGKGSFEHIYYQNLIKLDYEARGLEAEIEMNLGGKNADVGVRTEAGIEAVEVAISPEHETENIEKDLEAGFIKVKVVCKDKKVRSSIEKAVNKRFSEEIRQKTSITLISDYFPNIPALMRLYIKNLLYLILSKI